ncbi:MAG TPA: DUF1697 domain-containing protein [Patescibacteria group bacterium]|nr:DUF1697 domain-containing protein [Patescibacteria group bacterium]
MKQVAFIRGIGPENPNMHGAKLKEFFEKLGFKNVKTLLSSGNVLFESEKVNRSLLESLIEENLPKMLGFSRITIVRSYDDLKKIVTSDPFKGVEDAPTSRLNVTFLKKGGEIFTVIDTINTGTTKIMSDLEKKYGKDITTRTLKTVTRVIKKME